MPVSAKFEPSKSHGIVYGPVAARYEQDGKLFDGAGNQIADVHGNALPDDPADVGDPTAEFPEDRPVEACTVSELKSRYTRLTGKRIAAGMNSKGRIRQMILDWKTDNPEPESEVEQPSKPATEEENPFEE